MNEERTIKLTINQIRYLITALGHVEKQYLIEIGETGAKWAYEGYREITDLKDQLKQEVEDHE